MPVSSACGCHSFCDSVVYHQGPRNLHLRRLLLESKQRTVKKLVRRVNKKEQEAAVCIQTAQRKRWLRRPRVHSSAMHARLHPAMAVSASAPAAAAVPAPAAAVTAAAAAEKGDYRSDQIEGGPSAEASTGACPYNRPCAQQYVGKSQACMVISGRLIVHAPVRWATGWCS